MMSPRPEQIPVGFATRTITSNNYSDADITYLYNIFTCCYADMYYKFVKSFKRGNNLSVARRQSIAQLKYMKMGLRVLQNWYNPNPSPIPAICTLIVNEPAVPGGDTVHVDWYLSPNPLLFSNLSLLPHIATGSGSTWNAANSAAAAMLVALGYSSVVTSLGGGFFKSVITAPAIFGNFTQYIIFITSFGPTSPFKANYSVKFSGGKDIINPCLTLQKIQTLVQNMSKICGCFNCLNTAEVIADNYYVPVGQLFNKPSGQVLIPNPVN